MNKDLPKNFDYKTYISQNPDLSLNGINDEISATSHYLLFGAKEQRAYSLQKLIDTSTDIDFDPIFYLSEYPDVIEYYKDARDIPQTEKLFHHYLYYGKHEGRFKNKTEQEKSLIHEDFSILDVISIDQLVSPKNNLECVCLLTTSKEIENKQCQKFLKHLVEKTKTTKISKKIHFKIIVNRSSKIDISSLKSIFADVEIINLNLSKQDDLYTSHLSPQETLPKYGFKSGPNNMFFETINKCSEYDTVLLLETDCLLGNNWLNNLYLYAKYANGFLISGALYDGLVFTKAGSAMRNHINGGTALYATSNNTLQKLVNLLSVFLQKQIAYNMPGLAYDYGLKLLIDHNINNTFNNMNERLIWQFINRNYLPCKHIINCSTDSDTKINENVLMSKYNYAVLHKKTPAYK